MSDIDRYSYDVVVVGAGGSGLRAAIEAREQGKKTAIISKSLFGKAHTVMAEGDCAAALRAAADAFGVPRSHVTLVTGATSREKLIEIAGPAGPLARRLQELLGSCSDRAATSACHLPALAKVTRKTMQNRIAQ